MSCGSWALLTPRPPMKQPRPHHTGWPEGPRPCPYPQQAAATRTVSSRQPLCPGSCTLNRAQRVCVRAWHAARGACRSHGGAGRRTTAARHSHQQPGDTARTSVLTPHACTCVTRKRVHVCRHKSTHVYPRTRTPADIHCIRVCIRVTCVRIRVHACAHACVSARMCVRVVRMSGSVCTDAHSHVCAPTCICTTHTRVPCTSASLCRRAHVSTLPAVCPLSTYLPPCTRTYTCVHTHTRVSLSCTHTKETASKRLS